MFNTIKTSGHSSLEKSTSHFIWKGSKGLLKVLLCERWVGDWTELQHIEPHSYGHNSVSFPFSWAAQPGAKGPSVYVTWFSFQHLLSNWSELPVTGIWRPLFFLRASQFRTQFNPSTIKVTPDLLTTSTGCTFYLHMCISYSDNLAGSEVNIQHCEDSD